MGSYFSLNKVKLRLHPKMSEARKCQKLDSAINSKFDFESQIDFHLSYGTKKKFWHFRTAGEKFSYLGTLIIFWHFGTLLEFLTFSDVTIKQNTTSCWIMVKNCLHWKNVIWQKPISVLGNVVRSTKKFGTAWIGIFTIPVNHNYIIKSWYHDQKIMIPW